MNEDKEETKKTPAAPVKKVEKEFVRQGAEVNYLVTVVSNDKDPFHKNGAEWQCGEKKAAELEEAGWVTIKKEKK